MAPVPFTRRGGPARSLSSEAFGRSLHALDPDRDLAAAAYTKLRERTAGLIRWWGGVDGDALSDETLDRVARKLEDGVVIAPGSLGAYVRGVARLVFYESTRRARTEPLDGAAPERPAPAPESDFEFERRLESLDRCLEDLEPGDRALVLAYYGDGRKAEVRSRLAQGLGLSATALRIRAHRLRVRLEQCVTRRLSVGEHQ